MLILLMGVAGSGKTTVGRLLASRLNWPFYDADDFHSPNNIHKMAAGIPLTDEDRRPWLEQLRRLILPHIEKQTNAVLACSALKQAYRDILSSGTRGVATVYLAAPVDLIRDRMSRRRDHYMPAVLLESQFEALEEPEDALTLPAGWPPDQIVRSICSSLNIG